MIAPKNLVCVRSTSHKRSLNTTFKALELRELAQKFIGPLPDDTVDESCIPCADPRVPLVDVLDEQASSQCLTFSTDTRTNVLLSRNS